ncbi:ABC transporter ATP-binding protein [Devosia psychrophila]|nr:oligopeptide/dipeptide ABC transporter ATP-binding protein [Devosia psychrophila]KKC32820.1 hypothetical protein WH91_12005 [Devosia psychrophila]
MGLTVEFRGRRSLFKPESVVQAVSNVDLTIEQGETLAVVGESGCGKSTLGRALLRSTPIAHGRVEFKGRDITRLSGRALRDARSQFQMIFQDPYASLNPKMSIYETLAEPLLVHGATDRASIRPQVLDMLSAAGLDPSFAERYPHEFSGGQRQRVAIARAAILRPDFIVCDEPLSALDVSLQLQILKLFTALKQQFSLTYLFISHDLARVFGFADRIAVMYLGKIVEIGTAADLYRAPAHPYTRALIAAAPSPNPHRDIPPAAATLRGDIPSPANPPKGCRFHTRCPQVMDVCKTREPTMSDLGNGQRAACHLLTQPPMAG